MNRGRSIQRRLQRAVARGDLNAADVILRWRDRPAGDYDPILDAGNPAFAPTARNQTLKAFVHYATVGSTAFQRFSQIQTGDVILDFPGDPRVGNEDDGFRSIDSLTNLEFEVNGVIYVQKTTGEDLAKTWDVRVAGVSICRSLLVTPKA